MPIPLIVAGAAVAAKGVSTYFKSKRAKAALEAKKKAEFKAKKAQGASILNEVENLANPEYDDDPFTSNERSLYAIGGSPNEIEGGSSAASGYASIASSVMDIADTFIMDSHAKKDLEYESKKVIMNPNTSRFKQDAMRDKQNSIVRPDVYANGGGIKYNSANTAMVEAGSHESGDDLEFARPDGTSAKVEGNEGIRDVNGQVQIFSNRIPNPTGKGSIANKFLELSSLKGDLEEAKRSSGDAIDANTNVRKLAGVDKSLDNLYNAQEGIKDLSNAKTVGDVYANGGDGDKNDNDEYDTIKPNMSGLAPIQDPLENASHLRKLSLGRYGKVQVGEAMDVVAGSPEEQQLRNTYDYPYSSYTNVVNEQGDTIVYPVLNDKEHARLVKDKYPDVAVKDIYAKGGNGKNKYSLPSDDWDENEQEVESWMSDYAKPNDDKGINKEVEGKVKTNPRLAKTDALNVAATGLTLIDNIYNAKLINNMRDEVDHRSVAKVDLDKEINVDAQVHDTKRTLDNFFKNVDDNVSSSNVGLNMKLAATGESINQLNKVYDAKNKMESELKNREALVNIDIDKFNTQSYNRSQLVNQGIQDNKMSSKSANISNMIDDITKGLTRGIGIARDRETFVAKEERYADTGVTIKNVEAGRYDELTNNQYSSLIMKGFNAKGLSKEAAIKAYKRRGLALPDELKK